MKQAIVILFLLTLTAESSHAATIRVPSEQPTIQAGIDASVDGDTVLVADGTYSGTGNREIDYLGKTVTVTSENGADYSIIDCEKNGRGFNFVSGEDSFSKLEGFTITNGCPPDHGGGIYLYESSPDIADCIISGNIGSGYSGSGGGIYCRSSSPDISHCRIIDNIALGAISDGGGIKCYDSSSPAIAYCIISGNTVGDDGGGISSGFSSPELFNCNITGNISDNRGGGIYLYKSPSDITGCIISENTSSNQGGGIYIENSSPSMTDCFVQLNSSNNEGGGIFCNWFSCLTLTNNLITDNSTRVGGGVYCEDSSLYFTNCTLSRNSASNGGGIYCLESNLTIVNSILWDDAHEELIVDSGTPLITYSTIQGGWEGEGNIDEDPMFTAPQEGDFHLLPDSPSIDSGDPFSRLDLDSTINDMGCYGGMGDLPEGVIGGSVSGKLSKSGSPYIISENLVIESDSTLIVEKGVELLLHNHGGITVYGELLAEGAPDDSITIKRYRDWDIGAGIRFDGGSGTLVYCTIKHCRNRFAGAIYCRRASPTVSDCFISENTADRYGGGLYCFDSSDPSIRNCRITGNTSAFGGGIYLYESSPDIADCIISGNIATMNGGGIYCYKGDSPVISHCEISGNQTSDSDGDGGGIYCYRSSPTFMNCIITGNKTRGFYDCDGGGIYCDDSCPELSGCTISENTAGEGGGIYCKNDSSPVITECVIIGNLVVDDGGGLFCIESSPIITSCDIIGNITTSWASGGGGIYCGNSSPYITGCSITGNSAEDYGGGFYCNYYSSPFIVDCTIDGNSAGDFGGGLRCYDSSSPTIINCSLSGNTAGYHGGGLYIYGSSPIITNCIFWGDSPEEIYVYSGNPVVAFSDIQDGWPGEGNLDTDPFFVKREWGDYRICWDSPCIDSGHPDSLDPDGTRIDMGAHYFDQAKELLVYLSPETCEIAPGIHGSVCYTVCNSKPFEISFGTAAVIRLPDGSPWAGNPLEEATYASIAPSSNISCEFIYQVPPGWLSGTYSFATGVGSGSRIFDLDHFEFTVVKGSGDTE